MFIRVLPYTLAHLFLLALQWMAMLFLPLFFNSQDVGEDAIGVLVSMFSLATLVLVIPLGMLSDRVSPRALILAGALLVVLAASLLVGYSGFWAWLMGTFTIGAGFTLSWISLFSVFFKQVGERRRGLEVSVFNMGGILGAGLGAWAGGTLSDVVADPAVIFSLASLFAVAWAATCARIPETRGISFPILEYGRDLKSGPTWILIAIIFIKASHAGIEHANYSLLQTEVIGLTGRMVGELFFVLSLWMGIVTIATGGLHDRQEKPLRMMGAALVLSGAFMAASGRAVCAWDFLVYRVGHTGGDSILNLLTLVVASMIFPRHRAGGAFAFVLTVNTAAYFIFANIGGVWADRLSLQSSFYFAGFLMLAGGIVIMAFRGRIREYIDRGKMQDSNIAADVP